MLLTGKIMKEGKEGCSRNRKEGLREMRRMGERMKISQSKIKTQCRLLIS
jgi:hypothetical protein